MKHTQLTDDLQEQASLYAAGAMTDIERLEYLRHLDEDECPVCQAEVKELQSAISLLAFAVPSSNPSPRVKARLMEQAQHAVPRPEQQRRGFWWVEWVTAAVAVASMAVAFVVNRANSDLRNEANLLRSRVAQLEVQLTDRQNVIATLLASDRVVNLAGQGKNVQASAKVFWNQREKQWFLSVRDLPPPPPNQVYELWFVPRSGNPRRAVVFTTDAGGSFTGQIAVPDVALQAAAVTTEPAPGVDQPTAPQFDLLGAM